VDIITRYGKRDGDIKCSNKLHFQQINQCVVDITESYVFATDSVISRECSRQNDGRIAGWSELVHYSRYVTIRCSGTICGFIACDRPKTGAVVTMKKQLMSGSPTHFLTTTLVISGPKSSAFVQANRAIVALTMANLRSLV